MNFNSTTITAILLLILSVITIVISVYFIITYTNLKVNNKDHDEVKARKYLKITGWTGLCFSILIFFGTIILFVRVLSGGSIIINIAFVLLIILYISMGVISALCASYIKNGVNYDKNKKEYTTCFWIAIASLSLLILIIIAYSLYYVLKKRESKKQQEKLVEVYSYLTSI